MRIEERRAYYGKGDILVYRTGTPALAGLRPVPESGLTERPGGVLGANVEILVHGEGLWGAYERGDNSSLVATDSMKNFVQREALGYGGATLEGLVAWLAGRFLTRYPHLEGARLTATEVPLRLAGRAGAPVYSASRDERAWARLELERRGETLAVADAGSGLLGLRLFRPTGSAFSGFIRDEYTTLPDLRDRALLVHLDVRWRYASPDDATGEAPQRYVPAEQVGDIARAVLEEGAGESIQQYMHEVGTRLLARYPELAEVSLEGQNRSWDTVAEGNGAKVYTDPRPPYGILGLRLAR